MKAESLLQVLAAAHFAYKVRPDPYNRRGGIMLVAPAGHGKTTLLSRMSRELPKMLDISDLTTRQVSALRSRILEGKYTTLILDELEKLYQRKDATAMNVEGALQAIIEQGFSDFPGERPEIMGMPAQALVIANCTEEFFGRQLRRWSTAFVRRWLICQFRLRDVDIFANAIEHWRTQEMKNGMLFVVPVEDIPYSLTIEESRRLRRWLSMNNQDEKTPYQLLQRIACVLRWRDTKLGRKRDTTFTILEDFSECLRKHGAVMDF